MASDTPSAPSTPAWSELDAQTAAAWLDRAPVLIPSQAKHHWFPVAFRGREWNSRTEKLYLGWTRNDLQAFAAGHCHLPLLLDRRNTGLTDKIVVHGYGSLREAHSGKFEWMGPVWCKAEYSLGQGWSPPQVSGKWTWPTDPTKLTGPGWKMAHLPPVGNTEKNPPDVVSYAPQDTVMVPLRLAQHSTETLIHLVRQGLNGGGTVIGEDGSVIPIALLALVDSPRGGRPHQLGPIFGWLRGSTVSGGVFRVTGIRLSDRLGPAPSPSGGKWGNFSGLQEGLEFTLVSPQSHVIRDENGWGASILSLSAWENEQDRILKNNVVELEDVLLYYAGKQLSEVRKVEKDDLTSYRVEGSTLVNPALGVRVPIKDVAKDLGWTPTAEEWEAAGIRGVPVEYTDVLPKEACTFDFELSSLGPAIRPRTNMGHTAEWARAWKLDAAALLSFPGATHRPLTDGNPADSAVSGDLTAPPSRSTSSQESPMPVPVPTEPQTPSALDRWINDLKDAGSSGAKAGAATGLTSMARTVIMGRFGKKVPWWAKTDLFGSVIDVAVPTVILGLTYIAGDRIPKVEAVRAACKYAVQGAVTVNMSSWIRELTPLLDMMAAQGERLLISEEADAAKSTVSEGVRQAARAQ